MINTVTLRGYITSDIEKDNEEVRFIVSTKNNFKSKKNGYFSYSKIPCIAIKGYGSVILKNYATGSPVLVSGNLVTYGIDPQVYLVINNIDHLATMEDKEQMFRQSQESLKEYLEWQEYKQFKEKEE